MYLSHFGLAEAPFSIAPDPRFLYLSPRHREALAHLLYGLRTDGGFVLLTGEVGTGKTTTCRGVLAQTPDDTDLAFLLNPRVTERELLESICDELGIAPPAGADSSNKPLVDAIHHHLLAAHAAGRSTLLVIDEAQNLAPEVLEQVRLLTNLETDTRKLLRIILLGQPELGQMLASTALRQLAQRITARYHLDALANSEVASYINHRMAVAGASQNPFSRRAMRLAARASGGIPRRINVMCDRALLGAFTEQRTTVNHRTMARAIAEVDGTAPLRRPMASPWPLAAGLLLAIALGAGGGWWLQGRQLATVATAPAADSVAPVSTTPASNNTAAISSPPAALLAPAPALAAVAEQPAPAAGPSAGASADASADTSRDEGDRVFAPDTAVLALVEQGPPVTIQDATDTSWLAAATGHDDAVGNLFSAWDLPADRRANPCNHAATLGLRCSQDSGSWADLVTMGLPVAVRVLDQGQPGWLAVTAASDGRATLSTAEGPVQVPLASLVEHWSGDYTLLWPTPPGYQGSIGQGTTSAAVGYLRRALRQHTGQLLASRNPDLFDPELAAALTSFQQDQGLAPDGIAGTRTWIRIHTLADAGAPHVLHP